MRSKKDAFRISISNRRQYNGVHKQEQKCSK